MKVVCSNCKKQIGEKEPLADHRISHGMCDRCLQHFRRQWRGIGMSEYLDEFDAPVLLISSEYRVLAANDRMQSICGKLADDMVGLLGGEVLECRYSMLPEGCGHTIHCEACAIRMSVSSTIETGEPNVRVEAYVSTKRKKKKVWVSTYMRGGIVAVVLEEDRKRKAS